MSKVTVAKVSDVPAGTLHKVSVEGHDIVVANIDDKYYAIDDTCTHAGASISEGKIDGGNVICGWHGAQFDCASGKLAKFPAAIKDLKSYVTTVEGNDILVEV